jgi:hypothetical protein
MVLGWGSLVLICSVAALAWFWQDSLAARERANAAALEACERLSLQFLDGTAAFARLTLFRDNGGSLKLRRTYIFDYTANSIERRQGFVILNRHRVESVGFAPGDDGHVARTQHVQQAPHTDSDASKVIDFNQRRLRLSSSASQSEPREEPGDRRSDG